MQIQGVPNGLFQSFPNEPRIPPPTRHSVGTNKATVSPTLKKAPYWPFPGSLCEISSGLWMTTTKAATGSLSRCIHPHAPSHPNSPASLYPSPTPPPTPTCSPTQNPKPSRKRAGHSNYAWKQLQHWHAKPHAKSHPTQSMAGDSICNAAASWAYNDPLAWASADIVLSLGTCFCKVTKQADTALVQDIRQPRGATKGRLRPQVGVTHKDITRRQHVQLQEHFQGD